ncbi:MAG: hypothetical protein OXB88_01615 [Bacteriovoracales bacterium]|nr:hypothetical protein [Bacteriovoracales bacterium]
MWILIFSMLSGTSFSGGRDTQIQEAGPVDLTPILRFRPAQCPLTENLDSVQAILGRLEKNLRQFKCRKAEDGLSALEKYRENLGGLFMSGDDVNLDDFVEGESQDDVLLADQIKAMSLVVDELAEIREDKACLKDTGKKKFLENLADTILTFSKWRLLSSEGIEMSIYGAALSGLVRLINRFFKNEYNWNDHDERMLFNKFNCTFFEIRRNLDQMGIFRFGNEKTRKEEDGLNSELLSLKEQKKIFEEEINALEKERDTGFARIFENSFSSDEEKFYQLAKNFDMAFSLSSEGEIIFNETQLAWIFIHKKEIIHGLGKIPWDVDVAEELVPLVYDGLRNLNLNSSDDHPPGMGFLYGLFHHYIHSYEQKAAFIKKNWEEGRLVVLNSNIENKTKSIQNLNQEMTKKQNRIDILAYRNSRGEYLVNDSGVATILALHESYEKTATKIYGKIGVSFVKNMMKKMRSGYKVFRKGHDIFVERGYFDDGLSGENLNKVCSRANILIKKWGEANDWGQYGFDFFATNLDVFHDVAILTGKRSFKARRSSWIETQSYSALYAKALIDDQKGDQDHDGEESKGAQNISIEEKMEEYGLSSSSFGELMFRIGIESEKVLKLENFIKDQCHKINR